MPSLWRRHRWSSVIPGLPPPASSALDFSQAFDGLHLQSTCLFSFTQAPPLGFKEHKRLVADPRVPDRFIRRRSRPGVTKLGHAQLPEGRRADLLSSIAVLTRCSVVYEVFVSNDCQFVTHPTSCEQSAGEEDTPTCPGLQLRETHDCPRYLPVCHSPGYLRADIQGGGHTDMREFSFVPRENRSPQPATTAPLSEPQQQPPVPEDRVLHRSFTPRSVPRFAAITTFRLGLATAPPGRRALCATPLQYEPGANDSQRLSRRTTAFT